jgi:hypothetical protein
MTNIFGDDREGKQEKYGENEILRSFIIHTLLLLLLGSLNENDELGGVYV